MAYGRTIGEQSMTIGEQSGQSVSGVEGVHINVFQSNDRPTRVFLDLTVKGAEGRGVNVYLTPPQAVELARKLLAEAEYALAAE